MAIFDIHPIPTFVCGLLGNLISFMVFLAPLPTFYQVYKKKSTEGFQSIPYIISLFSAMLWLYYTLLKASDSFLLTINSASIGSKYFVRKVTTRYREIIQDYHPNFPTNSVGCFIQTVYIIFYLVYAPMKSRILTVKLILLFNVFGFGVIFLLTLFLAKGTKRVDVLGWICDSISVSVFAAPLCILRKVIRTKSVEYMPFFLSFFLTLSAIIWFCYGMLLKDYFVAVPNILGFILGVLQMILYMIYRKKKVPMVEEKKVPELSEEQIIDIVKLSTMVCPEVNPVTIVGLTNLIEEQVMHEQAKEVKKSAMRVSLNV